MSKLRLKMKLSVIEKLNEDLEILNFKVVDSSAPWGELKFNVTDQDQMGKFKEGESWYLDLTKASK